nr:nucleoside transporter fun26 [Quercus suber]
MERIRRLFRSSEEQSYEPLSASVTTDPTGAFHDDDHESDHNAPTNLPADTNHVFSSIDYAIFVLLGVSMLWAWNMFLVAGPYFQHRFRRSAWISDHFQAAEISVSTLTSLGSLLILTRLQQGASYPKRIVWSLVLNMVVFTLLAISTVAATGVSAAGYFAFLMVMIFATSAATALCQNGIFAYVAGFGDARYTQGIMTGQGIAGVLPCIVQIVSVLSVSTNDAGNDGGNPPDGSSVPVSPASAFSYFLTATIISVIALLGYLYLAARNPQARKLDDLSSHETVGDTQEKKDVPLVVLFRKLFYLATGVFLTFGITMFFPVFTQRIVSVRAPSDQPLILQPPSFIPLAFLFWNSGDLLGRLLTAVPALSLVRRPRLILTLAVARLGFVGLYHLCNIGGRGAVIQSDFFYLVVVQLLFGLSNGFIGTACMIGASEWVKPDEREAAGGFMVLSLVAGLAVGSLLSFFVGDKNVAFFASPGPSSPLLLDVKSAQLTVLIAHEIESMNPLGNAGTAITLATEDMAKNPGGLLHAV